MTKKAQDVLNDNSHAVLYKIAQTMDFKLPAYVEEGVPLDKEAAAGTPDNLFADDVNRRFPLTDRANTWLSGAYFAKTASDHYGDSEYRRVAKRIFKAAELYGISDDVCAVMGKVADAEMQEAAAQAEKQAAAAEACYGEPETGAFPMFDADQVKMACDYFDENAYAYDWRRRASIARNILRKAAEYGITPPGTVRKEAGAGFPRRDFLAENLLSREAELERRGLRKMAGDMRRTIKIVCEADPEDLMKNLEPLREMVSGSDELSGIDEEYGRRFLPPADFIFDIGDDEAKEFQEDTIPLGGELLSAKALSGLPMKLFKSVMSPETFGGMLDGGRLSPKKMSITIIKMAPRDQHSLLDAIQDFTSGADFGRYDDEGECGEECEDGENAGKDKEGKED